MPSLLTYTINMSPEIRTLKLLDFLYDMSKISAPGQMMVPVEAMLNLGFERYEIISLLDKLATDFLNPIALIYEPYQNAQNWNDRISWYTYHRSLFPDGPNKMLPLLRDDGDVTSMDFGMVAEYFGLRDEYVIEIKADFERVRNSLRLSVNPVDDKALTLTTKSYDPISYSLKLGDKVIRINSQQRASKQADLMKKLFNGNSLKTNRVTASDLYKKTPISNIAKKNEKSFKDIVQKINEKIEKDYPVKLKEHVIFMDGSSAKVSALYL